MFAVITVIHVLSCIFLILVVLLQTGKGAEMGAVFGGSSSTVFGSTGAGNFLTRLTTATAVIFMLTSLSLTYFSARQSATTILDNAPAASAPAPAVEDPLGAAPDLAVPDGAPVAAPVVDEASNQAAPGAADHIPAAPAGEVAPAAESAPAAAAPPAAADEPAPAAQMAPAADAAPAQ